MPSRLIALFASGLVLAACAGSTAPAPTTTTAPTTSSEPARPTTTLPRATSTSTTAAAPPASTSVPQPTSTTTTTTTAPATDGLNWARVPLDRAFFGVAALPGAAAVPGGTGIVTVGADVSGEDWDAAVWFSADGGRTRERVPHDEEALGGPGHQAMVGVVTLGPRLVAVGFERKTALVVVDGVGTIMESQVYDAAVWTSVDGITWVRVLDDGSVFSGAEEQDDQTITAVTPGGPGLVAVGYERDRWYRPEARFNVRFGIDTYAAVWTSADGTTWTRVPNATGVFGAASSQYEMRGVASWRGGLVAVGTGVRPPASESEERRREAVVWTSADGITWTRAPSDEAVLGGEIYEPGIGHNVEMSAVAPGGPGLVAVGRDQEFWWDDAGAVRSDVDAAVWVSADGIVWIRVPHDEAVFGGDDIQEMTTIIAGPFGLVALGFDDSLAQPGEVMWVTPPPG